MKYGYLGPVGTHCEEALYVYLGNNKVEMQPLPSIEHVLAAVQRDEISHAFVPLENSIEGTVNITLDLINRDSQLKIVGEVIHSINNNLLIKVGTCKNDVNLVISHPQALAQCREYINRNFPGVPIMEVNSTAEAARLIANEFNNAAAIGNKRAADYYGLEIADSCIQDCSQNRTRFVVVSKHDRPVSGPAKTSLVVSITDRPGGLYQILKEFALRNINLTRIESRPAKTDFGKYFFFIDLAGYVEDPLVRECLEAIRHMAASFRILGSYPVTADFKPGYGVEELTLEEVRDNIDIIDYQIVDLLAQRTQLVSLVGSLKKQNEWDSVRDKQREREILERAKRTAMQKGVSLELVEDIYRMLFKHFVELQKKQK